MSRRPYRGRPPRLVRVLLIVALGLLAWGAVIAIVGSVARSFL